MLSKPSPKISSLLSYLTRSFNSKRIYLSTEVREKILQGVNRVADTVQVTLGPRGRNVLLDTEFGEPKILNQGLAVSKAISFSDRHVNMGANLIKQVANKVSTEAGDGTSTATILTREIFREGCKCITAGMNPMEIRKGMITAASAVDKYLQQNAVKIKTKEEIENISTIAANNDKEIGKLVANIIEKIGIDGTVNVQNGKTLKNEVEIVEGIRFNRGYVSGHFVNNQKVQRCEYDNALVVLSHDKFKSVKEMTTILEQAIKKQKPLLLIGTDYDSEVLSMLIINKLKNKLKICAVRSPAFGENRKNTLEDYAIATGGIVLDKKAGVTVESIKNLDSLFGKAKKIIATKEECIIIGADNTGTPVLNKRIELIKELMNKTSNEYEKEKFQTRLNRLTGGIAIVKVGGASETEVDEIKDKIEHTVNATKSALSEGILPGGGSALLYAIKELDSVKLPNNDQETGLNIVKNALKVPVKALCKNSGINGDLICEKLLARGDRNYGINILNGEICNLVKNGIVDPVKVIRSQVTSAIRAGGLMLTTEAGIVDDETQRKKPEPQGDFE